uniref:Uncharacterized protein n=1 Tax=Anguilla anguilla TaxID=7936 RepID=A0A0E9S2Z8_ANGAN
MSMFHAPFSLLQIRMLILLYARQTLGASLNALHSFS